MTEWFWSEEALEDSVIDVHRCCKGLFNFSFPTGWYKVKRQHVQVHNASALRQHILVLMSIFCHMEISKTHVWREIMAPLLPVLSLFFFFCCSLELCGCWALKTLACVINRLWFGKSPKCHDVYFKQRAVDFHSFTSSVVFHEDGHFASYPGLNSR